MNAGVKPHVSATAPARSGPRIMPKSLCIWKVASTGAPSRLLPITSATEACSEGVISAAPAPIPTMRATSIQGAEEIPIVEMAVPAISKPIKIIMRRPKLSDRRPETVWVRAFANEPTAITVEARTVPSGALDASPPVAKYAASRGIREDCMPKTAQPIVKFVKSADR